MLVLRGGIFPAAYAFLFNQRLPIGSPVARGAAYGVLGFVLAAGMLALLRTMGLMPPAGDRMLLSRLGMLMGHLVFGAGLGSFSAPGACP